MSKVLIIEDDESLGSSLSKYIEEEGMRAVWCRNLKEARDFNGDADIIILDWMLPDGQGVDYLREIRAKGNRTPIVMLTARTELIDKVIGLESGANDYITKPFEPRELVARIRVQLRDRSVSADSKVEDQKIILGDLSIDPVRREVIFKGKNIEFTKMEFDFLRLLAENPGRAYSREEILNKVWGYENYPTTRTVDTHVLQIRQKLYDELIETVRGVGYKLKYEE